MSSFIILILIILVFAILSERWLQKKLKIEKPKGFIYKGVNAFHKWIEGLMLLIFLISIWFVENTFHLLVFYIFILFSFRALIEWKYEREKKKYILTLHSIFIYFLFLGTVIYYNFL